jgi:hypothetical protein
MKTHLKLTVACCWLLCLFASAAHLSAATITDPPGGGAFSGEAKNNPSPTDYFWTPDSDGRMDLSASAYGPFDRTFIEVKSNGQSVGGNQFLALAGVNYVITVSTDRGANHDLRWTFTPTAPNDKFANAIDISAAPYNAYSGYLEGNAEVATDELPENDPAPARDVWFRWVAPEDGKANFGGNCGGACDVALVVYRGTSLTNLVNVSGGERLSVQDVPVKADTTYYIALRAGPGPYSLGWSFNPDAPRGPRRLWSAGRDLVTNEKRNDTAEQTAVNARVPEWSYGTRAQAASTALTLFRPELHVNGTDGMEGWKSSDVSEGILTVNTRSTVEPNPGPGYVFPQQLLLHPSSSNAFAVARWTAPADGWYRLYAEWRDLDANGGNGASGHVVINGREVFGRKVPADQFGPERFVGLEWNDGGNAAMAAETFKLKAGDVVDFALGSRGDAKFDSTTFNSIVRRVPGVEITNAPPQARTEEGVRLPEGTDVTLEVQVDSAEPVREVTLLVNGTQGASDTAPPYSLTETNLQPGVVYYFSVKVTDAEGVRSVSEQIKVVAERIPPGAATRRNRKGAEASSQDAAVFTGGRTYYSTQSGAWEDPATWGGAGVPGRNDDAMIMQGTGVTTTDYIEVQNMSVAGGLLIGSPESPRIVTVYGTLEVHGTIQGGDRSSLLAGFTRSNFVAGQATLRNLIVALAGQTIVTGNGGIAGSDTSLEITGAAKVFSPPGTNRPTRLAADEITLRGAQLALGSYGQLYAPAGIINSDGASIINSDGAGIINSDGAGVINSDTASLIGTDGATLIGTDGATLIGTDGATLIGTDGATLIGTDGATILSDAAGGIPAPAGKTGSTPETTTQREATGGSSRRIILQSGTISGRINLVGDVLNSGGFISPGNPTGRITVKGNYTQEAGGTLLLDVGGTQTSPLEFDQLQISGAANFGGRLIVKTINGFTPPSGSSFAPLSYGAVNGSFESVSSNAQVAFGATGMTMQVTGPNPPAPKALNIATRMRVETGDNVLIAGFIVTGDQPKKVLIRGIGPSLPVSGALADTILNLDAGSVVNDDWKSDQEQEIRDTTIPPSSDLESAILATLEPGLHTAVLRGKNDGTGVGLVEVYDLESGTPAQLANISTRGQVQTGDNVMIGGFIIGGDYPAKVLLRAIGPSLAVGGALPDPTLELVDGQGNTISNDNWRATQEAEITATTVPPTNDREAAIVATLVPGNYTAVVRGKDDTTGVALVEGYNLQ